MTVHRLDNAAWGFDSNCFVCEPRNERGLRIAFSYDDEADVVTAEYTLDDTFSGAPKYVHGGVSLAILDEAMAWAAIASTKAFSVTSRTTTSFLRPIHVGRQYRVEARIVGKTDSGALDARATIINGRDKPCAEAQAEFVPLSADQAKSAIGEVSGDDAGYVKG